METCLNRLAHSTRLRILTFVALSGLIALLLLQPFQKSRSTDFPVFIIEDYTYPSDKHEAAITQLRPKRVAVVGAGASGSAAAFFLRRAGRVMEERIGVSPGNLIGDIVVFDKEGYVGGRT